MVANTSAGETYSPGVAYVYIFNLIVGVGALALPAGFKQAGLILGLIFLAVAGFLAFITITWVNEVQAAGNALLSLKESESLSRSVNSYDEEPQGPITVEPVQIRTSSSSIEINGLDGEQEVLLKKRHKNVFDITRRVELGLLSELFLGKVGHKLFYVVLVTYLYGDLAIYSVTIPTSLSAVVGGWCVKGSCISDHNSYYLYLGFFILLIVPWSFFNFQKTKPLQIATLFTRNLALFMMIILGLIYVSHGDGAKASDLSWFDFRGLPSLFGVSIYAFMCHHSLPGLVTPIRNKNYLNRLLGGDFVLIFLVYSLLCASALFAFGANPNAKCGSTPGPACELQPLYTLNFTSYHVRVIAVFLALFPVFTLSTNFPLIAITLRNNLMILVPWGEKHHFWGNPTVRQIVFALIATMPPIALAFATRDVDLLVSITGSYAGLGIMFVIPGFLLVWSRRAISKLEEKYERKFENPHKSPFGHTAFLVIVAIACLVSLVLVTFNLVYRAVTHHKF